MSLETGLNILWVSLALAALGVLVLSEFGGRGTPVQRWMRALSVVLAAIFLFPCVSASDDLLSIQNLQFTLETRGEVGNPLPHPSQNNEKHNAHLVRLFETLQHVQVATHYSLPVTLGCVGEVLAPPRVVCERRLHSLSGRDPPAGAVS